MIDRISELEATITDAFGMLAGLLRFPEDQAAGDAEIGDASDALAELVEIAGKQERLLTEWTARAALRTSTAQYERDSALSEVTRLRVALREQSARIENTAPYIKREGREMRKRWLVLLLPWPALRSLRLLVEQPLPPEPCPLTDWDRGYDRALYEVGLNIGVPRD